VISPVLKNTRENKNERGFMDIVLTPVEVRVLGSLVEKELTTPEYYPLSLIALVAACNQKSNRDPVMTLTNDDVTMAVDSLRGKNLAWQLNTVGGRVPKFEHNLPARLKILTQTMQENQPQDGNEAATEGPDAPSEQAAGSKAVEFNILRREIAVLCVLMLRGPLTIGEIRGCTGRMCPFKDLPDVEECVTKLSAAGFVAKLPRLPGTKENRFCHCFSGEPAAQPVAVPIQASQSVQPLIQPGTVLDRLIQLEQKVTQVTEDISGIRQAFEEFRKKFE
jgi:uncharacterized protein YceH (UPF0502 family)